MRIYEGSPRQDWEEVLRSLGAFADGEGLQELLLVEVHGRFILQSLGLVRTGDSAELGVLQKLTHEFDDERIAELMEQGVARRGTRDSRAPAVDDTNYYEQAFRAIGRYCDQRSPRDLFFLEQDGNFVLRLLEPQPGGSIRHSLAEFTRDDILSIIDNAPRRRGKIRRLWSRD